MTKSFKEWAAGHDIEPEEHLCENCGAVLEYTQPIQFTGYEGFESPDHGCGEEFTACILIPVSEEKLDFWRQLEADIYQVAYPTPT